MADYIIAEESQFRLVIFLTVLVFMGLWEALSARRGRIFSRRERWLGNLGLILVDSLAIRLVMPIIAVDLALISQANGWGLFNMTAWPAALEVVAAIILLDFVVYWQHVVFHRIPLLWRLHAVHHTDRDLDATSALRFHPVEMILSMLLKMIVVVALGVSPLAVIVFEVILNATALFNHANIKIASRIEPWLRLFIVTPDMHRIHHSVRPDEYNRNFGFNLSLWDRLFSSYVESPQDGQQDMTIGLTDHQTDETRSLLFMLVLPFRRKT
jgi:sterol desaturase/sphingolipid hydroxylase (fatty acid hydroxylase superfamily)